MSGLSPLQRRIMVELVSVVRDREPDPEFWPTCHVRTGELFTACRSYWPTDRAAPWVNLERNARQAFGRSLHRLQAADLIWPLALAYCDVESRDLIRWRGGGSRQRDGSPYGRGTPRYALISPSPAGIALIGDLS